LTQTQGVSGNDNGTFENLPNVPGTSLATQAAVVAGSRIFNFQGFDEAAVAQSQIGVIQTVNILRFNSLSISYIPSTAVMRFFHVPSMSISLQGENLGLHTNYRGADPNVNAYSTANLGDVTHDTGQLPQPRTWALAVRLGN
jgi:hypothetical protein